MIQSIEPRGSDLPARLPQGPNREAPPHPFLILHRLLRGRYAWCVALAVLGAAIGSVIGYRWTVPLYRCDGIIHVKPLIAPVLTQIPENGYIQGFASFIDLQMAWLRSDRLISVSVQSPEWRQLGRGGGDDPVGQFRNALMIKTPSKVSQMITVSFIDPDPRATQAAVRALLTAYDHVHVEGENQAEEKKKELLDERRLALSNELSQKQETIRQAAAHYGTDNLRQLNQMKVENLQRLENSLTDVEFALAALGVGGHDREAGAEDAPAAPTLAPEEIALRDGAMARLLGELQQLRTEAQLHSASLGANHPRMQGLRMLIVARQQQVHDHAATWNAAQAKVGGLSAGVAGLSSEELRMRQARYKEMIAQLRRELSELGRVMLDIERLGREKDEIVRRLDETRRRLDLLNFESPMQGRIEIASLGEQPVLDKDKRIPLAMVGGIGGAGVGIGLVVLFALLDRRMRSPDDAGQRAGQPLLLGMLPTLPDDLTDPEEAAIAAHCVHRIRTMLQVTSGRRGHRVFALTSPTAGAGKTSLTLALGASYAAANVRTLMIDCDVLGQGLSARVGRSLARQGSSRVGLLDALAGGPLVECTVETGIRGLFILPAGRAGAEDVSLLSPESLRVLMERARADFDIILVDTGPVLGSLEASLVATTVDGIVLVLSRGESRILAERAVSHLREIGAPISGMVFNRANTRDLERSSATSRISAAGAGMSRVGQDDSRAALGPLASVVHTRRSPNYEPKPE